MGVKLREIIVKKEIKIEDLKNKKLVFDGPNILYQFLTTIRQRDGTSLKDSKGKITSHLIGLFNRTTKLMKKGLKPAFVFDGAPPKLKFLEYKRRKTLKQEAELRYKVAAEAENIEEMKKYASRTAKLTKEMIDEAKDVIKALGLPLIQAPCEGEAQAAHIVKKGHAYASVSQDYDSLLHGVPRLVQNLTISERRKIPGKISYTTVKPQIIDLSENLNKLGIDQNQLIVLAMLIGTDYNIGGIKGIGPRNALRFVKQYKNDFDDLFMKVKWNDYFDYPWMDVYYLIKKMPVSEDYELKWRNIDKEKLISVLCEKHDFSYERVKKTIDELSKKEAQAGLGEFA